LDKRGPKQQRWDAASARAREELLRPCPYIGFDHDRIGAHCLSREAYAIAELSFRRAIWLNPYKPGFHLHLAYALFRQKRHEDALGVLNEVREKWPDFVQERELREAILQGGPILVESYRKEMSARETLPDKKKE
jgi:tetratricopeptide (TPR) repeat protein